MSDRNSKGQFPVGTSGNLKGRPEGVKNKRMTNRQVQEYLGKRKEHYFRQIEEIAKMSMQPTVTEVDDNTGEAKEVLNTAFDPKLSFTCFKELIGIEIQVDIFEYKKSQDKKKNSNDSKKETEEDVPDMGKVVSGVFNNK